MRPWYRGFSRAEVATIVEARRRGAAIDPSQATAAVEAIAYLSPTGDDRDADVPVETSARDIDTLRPDEASILAEIRAESAQAHAETLADLAEVKADLQTCLAAVDDQPVHIDLGPGLGGYWLYPDGRRVADLNYLE